MERIECYPLIQVIDVCNMIVSCNSLEKCSYNLLVYGIVLYTAVNSS
jgi:hypothetical protein